jgi:putative protease
VAKAYRMVIDDFTKIEEARELLRYDTGREKTSYFMGKSVADSITTHTNTGILTGKVTQTSKERFYFSSEHPVKENFRLRIHAQKGDVRSALKAKDLKQENHGHYSLPLTDQSIQKGDNVFIASAPFKSFPSKFKKIERLGIKPPHPKLRKKINQAAKEKSNAHTKKRESLWLRIDTLEWLKKISFNYFDHVILNFDKKNWQDFKPESPFIQKNKEKIFIELPKFIAEKDITFYKELLEKLNKQGIHNSSVSHLSQKLLLPGTNRYICNENVYAFNDFSIRQIYTENASTFIYPVEISQEELVSYQNKTGIVPLYFFPELFYSRMPLKELSSFKDEKNKEYTKTVKNGITVVHPTEAVSLIQYKDFLIKKGFYRFLIDLSHARPTNNLAKKLIKRYNQSDQVQPSTIFNFKRGLK